MKVKAFFAWYDFWVGLYYDRNARTLYFCPIPCVVFKFYYPGIPYSSPIVNDADWTGQAG